MEYSYKLIHKPGKYNKANYLSRHPDYNQGKDDNQDVLVLPNSVFACAVSLSSLEQQVFDVQLLDLDLLASWRDLHPHMTTVDNHWFHCHVPIVVEDNALKREVLTQYHNHPLAGHPRIFKTYLLVSRDYWWPDLKQFVKNYVKGCATCQMTKSHTNKLKIPIFPITTERNSTPFETITVNLIVDLPHANDYDSILTITNHNCTKAALFLPCNQTIDAPGITQLYAQHMFPHYGVPKKVISDRDPRFTATFVKELC